MSEPKPKERTREEPQKEPKQRTFRPRAPTRANPSKETTSLEQWLEVEKLETPSEVTPDPRDRS